MATGRFARCTDRDEDAGGGSLEAFHPGAELLDEYCTEAEVCGAVQFCGVLDLRLQYPGGYAGGCGAAGGVCADALFAEWPKADAIIGNPPFLGGYRIRSELGDEYAERIFQRFSDVIDQVDLCSYWFRLAHDNLGGKGRAGLVGTNTISQIKTRRASLGYITDNQGIIHDAISSQPWSGEAFVHVSLVNWNYEPAQKAYLNGQLVKIINSSLTSSTDLSKVSRLRVNQDWAFEGVKTTGKGFLISEKEVNHWIASDERNREVLKLFSTGSDLTRNPSGRPESWIIDFDDLTIEEASEYVLPFEHIKVRVKPARDRTRRETRRINWWRFGENAPKLRRKIKVLNQCFRVSRVSKWFIFIPVSTCWIPSDATTTITSDDFYVLGLITSDMHRQWVKAQSSTLEDRTRYTSTTCFRTFPFPQTPTQKQIDAIRQTAIDLHEYRSQQMEKKGWGITKLYNEYFHEPASQLAKLHAQLDKLVLQAYGFKESDDLLEKLLALNLELATKEKAKAPVIGPWAPDKPPQL